MRCSTIISRLYEFIRRNIMNRFWNVLILPIIEKIHAEYIVEIGSHTGLNTINILEYCLNSNARMTAIDPFPKFDINEFKSKYGDKFEIYTDISLNILPALKDYDVVMIDGDHNWYTVYNELKTIETRFKNKKLPLIFLHDINWPYGRRDLYYNPEDIPEEYRQPFKKLGMYPGQSSLMKKGGLNPLNYNNAIHENTPKNGILTAVEDFIAESDIDLSFNFIPAYHGLGILYPSNKELQLYIEKIINDADFLSDLEEERIKLKLSQSELNYQKNILAQNLNRDDKKIDFLKNQLDEKINKLNKSNILLKKKTDELNDVESQLKSTKKRIRILKRYNQYYGRK